jgi:phenylalanyl-tRNA synthetase alpha subunit
MSKRRRIIQQLQERIHKIDEEIKKVIQDRYIHSSTIRELSKECSEGSNDSEEEISELSIEIISQEDKLKPFKSEKNSKKTEAKRDMRKQEHGHWMDELEKRNKRSGSTKENNKNASNAQGVSKTNKKFTGGNAQVYGKVFELSSRNSVHQFAETVKAIADYVGQEYTHGGDIRYMIENFEDYNFIRPQDPLPNADQFEIESWKKQLDLFWKRRGVYMDNKMKLYSLIWGQSSKTTHSKVETHQNFAQCKGSL